MTNPKICSRCILDAQTPEISFDNNGECNYCKQWDELNKAHPNDNKLGKNKLLCVIQQIKKKGRKKKYDLVIGVSGGTDSTYLLHMAKKYDLRPLAVHLDNGWNSSIAVMNIKNALDIVGCDLETHVVHYQEMKDIMLSYLKAGIPWADIPTDIALVGALYKVAAKYNIKYIWVGNNFRTEGKQPTEWTYGDSKQLKSIHKKFGKTKIRSFPSYSLFHLLWYGFFKDIKMFRPFYYIDFNKKSAQEIISKNYGWTYYGGHHHENIFTKFIIGSWLPQKFGIDKRKITLSALIRSKEITRENALIEASKRPYNETDLAQDRKYVSKKLGITPQELEKIWNNENKTFADYPSYYPLLKRLKGILKIIYKYIFPFKPMLLFDVKDYNKD